MYIVKARWLCLCLCHILRSMALFFKETLVLFLDFWNNPQWQIQLGSFVRWVLFSRQSVSSEQWCGFHLHLWPWEAKRDMAGLSIYGAWRSWQEWLGCSCRKETLWDKNKLAGDVCNSNSNPCREGRGHWESGACGKSEEFCCGPLSPSIGRAARVHFWLVLESFVLGGCDCPLQREEGLLFNGVVSEISVLYGIIWGTRRDLKKGGTRQVPTQGQAGWF